MATLTVNTMDKDGFSLSTATPTASTGDQAVVADDNRHFILVYNGSGASINVTVTAQRSTAPQAGVGPDVSVSSIVHAVAAGAIALIPVLPAFIRLNDGLVQFVCSSVTTVQVAVVKYPRLTV